MNDKSNFSGNSLLIAIFLATVSFHVALAWTDNEHTSRSDAPIPDSEFPDPSLNERDNAFLNRQAEALLGLVDETLLGVPPQLPEPRERRLALWMLDAVMHDVYAPSRKPVQDFFHQRIARVADELETITVKEGARIWMLYNIGYIVRTASVTIAFDLHRGTRGYRIDDPVKGRYIAACPGFPVSQPIMDRIISQCDVLFISHRHADHTDPDITSSGADPYGRTISSAISAAFIDLGKIVVAPPDIWEGGPLHDQITHLKREAHTVQKLAVKNGALELDVVVYPGQQYQGGFGVPNNVVIVYTPENISFSHNGDQINDPYPEYQKDYKWIDKVRDYHDVDVLFTNCWMNDIHRFVKGFDPKLVIPGHQNELGHSIFDRVPYWPDLKDSERAYEKIRAEGYPILELAWGESYHYAPKKKRD